MNSLFKYLCFSTLIILLCINNSTCQVTAPDCSVAVDICTNQGFTISPNGPGNVVELTGPNVLFGYTHNFSNPDHAGIFNLNPWGTNNFC